MIIESETTIEENSAAGTFLADIIVIDEDMNQSSTCRLLSGSEYFTIDKNASDRHNSIIKVAENALLDYEAKSLIEVNIECTDNGKPLLSIQRSITVTLLDVNEAPTDIRLSGNHTLPENSPVGWSLGTLSTSDPDNGQVFTFALFGQSADIFEVRGWSRK